ELLEEARDFTRTTLVNRCFGLGDLDSHPNDLILVQRRTTTPPRLPAGAVIVGPCQDEEPTSLEPFRRECPGTSAELSWRPDRAATLVACCETTSTLEPRQVYVVRGGVALQGRLVAWRYPCYTITDLQIYEAVLPPPFVAVADNAITYSDKGHGNTLMAGGDLDGDHVMVAFWCKLVDIMERTQSCVARLDALLQLYEQDVLSAVVPGCTAWESAVVPQRGQQLVKFASGASSYNARGHICGLHERFLARALESSSSTQRVLLDANDVMGRVWLPPGQHILGAEAARLLRPHLLGSGVRPHDRRPGSPCPE
ncbi:unnamed protein product, partial [Symbiodinium necroappetens]